MYRNEADDRRTDTIAQANAVGMGFGGEKAYRAWLADQGDQAPEQPPQPGNAAALAQTGAIMRLQSLFGRQASAGLKGAIRIKRPD